MAARFDIARLAVTGEGVPVVEGVLQPSLLNGAAQYSFSNTGSLIYLPASGQGFQRRLVWVNRNGAEEALTTPLRAYRNPRLSPDGQRIAVEIEERTSQVWLYDIARGTLSRLTLEGSTSGNPVWTPDGARITFGSTNREGAGLFWQRTDGSGGPERLCCDVGDAAPLSSWSPDGQLIAGGGAGGAGDLSVLRRGDGKPQVLLQTPFGEGAAMFSPDGRWLAYSSNESGSSEIYLQSYPGPGGKWQISAEGGTEPMWNRNGRELFYRTGNRMMAVDIAAQPSFSASKPRLLFEGQYEPTLISNANYDVSPDGQRFLMLKASQTEQAAPTQINVVLNWFEELKRRVTTK
jgi:eukaryotic-like serine/threonine-protein kinase